MRSPGGRRFVEDFARLDLIDVRRALGGARKLNSASAFLVNAPGGGTLQVRLVRRPHGFGMATFLACPRCDRACRVLHVTGVPELVICLQCLRRVFSVKFRSQVQARGLSLLGD